MVSDRVGEDHAGKGDVDDEDEVEGVADVVGVLCGVTGRRSRRGYRLAVLGWGGGITHQCQLIVDFGAPRVGSEGWQGMKTLDQPRRQMDQ
jgi:hypothetical protein